MAEVPEVAQVEAMRATAEAERVMEAGGVERARGAEVMTLVGLGLAARGGLKGRRAVAAAVTLVAMAEPPSVEGVVVLHGV